MVKVATPSGKVELKSSILESLGFDPLPYFRDDPEPDRAYPLTLFMGVREDEFFQTGHRHIAALRERRPEPEMFIHPDDAAVARIVQGDWAEVETKVDADCALRFVVTCLRD